jgi:hypothetical protein
VQFPWRNWTWAPLLLSLVVIGGLLVGCPGDLVSRAARVAATQGIVTNEASYSGYHFFYHHTASWYWLSDNEILSIREVARGVYESAQINLSSGQITRSPGRMQLDVAQDKWDKTFYWTVSPDGKWILYVGSARGSLIYDARRFNGSARVTWNNRFEGVVHPTWLSDSSGFIEWPMRELGRQARVHLLSSHDTAQFKIDDLPAGFMSGKARLEHPFAQVPSRIQTTTNTAGEFLELKQVNGKLALQRFLLPIPAKLRRGEGRTFISPQGDRVAWVYAFQLRVPRFWFERTYPYVETRPRYSTVVLASGADGDGLGTIGVLGPGSDVGTVTWNPDGKRLGFVHDGSLWTVPVP